MNQQRKIIYEIRKKILGRESSGPSSADSKNQSLKEEILEKIAAEITSVVTIHGQEGIDAKKITEEISSIVPVDQSSIKDIEKQISGFSNSDEVIKFLSDLTKHFYEQREKEIGDEVARQMEVFVYLNTIDTLWIEHLDTMDDLRSGIGLRGYAQRDPLVEYKKEGFELFEKLMVEIDYEIVHRIYKVALQGQEHQGHSHPVVIEEKHAEIEVGVKTESKELKTGKDDTGSVTKVIIDRGGVLTQEVYGASGEVSSPHGRVGRNDPCWCGSGKKYKKCHYPN